MASETKQDNEGEENALPNDSKQESEENGDASSQGDEEKAASEKIEDAKEEIGEALEKGDDDKAEKILNRLETWLEKHSNSTAEATEKLQAQITALATKIALIQPKPLENKSPPQEQAEAKPAEKPAEKPNENAEGQKDQQESPRARRRSI